MDPGPSDAFYSFDFLEGHRWDPGPLDASPHGILDLQKHNGFPNLLNILTFRRATDGYWTFRCF